MRCELESITINEYVSENGIFLKPELLSQFKNNKVKIIISQAEENIPDKEFMKFAGILNSNEADELSKNIEDCRNIDIESWQ